MALGERRVTGHSAAGSLDLILFDINGVLYDYDKAARIAFLSRISGRAAAEIDRDIWQSGFEDRGDAGEMDAAAYLAEFAQRLGHPLDVEQWEEAARLAVTPIPSMLALATRAAGRARVGALTNNNLLVSDRMDRLFPLLRPLFGDAVCVSSQFGVCKPEPEVYRRAASALASAPERTLFIDDSEANVAGAVAAGLQGHVHTDAALLEARLAAAGVI